MEPNKFVVSFSNAIKSTCCSIDKFFLEMSISIYVISLVQTSFCKRLDTNIIFIHSDISEFIHYLLSHIPTEIYAIFFDVFFVKLHILTSQVQFTYIHTPMLW